MQPASLVANIRTLTDYKTQNTDLNERDIELLLIMLHQSRYYIHLWIPYICSKMSFPAMNVNVGASGSVDIETACNIF